MNAGWIWTENLRPFAETVAGEHGYAFDDLDWAAIEVGVDGTDSEDGPWFEYPLGELGLSAALEPGADEIVSVRLEGLRTTEAATKVRWLAEFLRSYRVRRD